MKTKTIILEKTKVKANYKFFDSYRYTLDENITNACKHYINKNNTKYGIDINNIINVKIFKNTYHVQYEI